jgi:hypothetical protein
MIESQFAMPGEVDSQRRLGTGRELPIRVLGVDYLHRRMSDGSDLYLTRRGAALGASLDPCNWLAPDWFAQARIRLPGTSNIYRVLTRPLPGLLSRDLVVRYSRVGQDVPLDTLTLKQHVHAEFNSPFEEFALITALRAARAGPARSRLLTKAPLAIYSPADRLELWQTGRKESKMAAKQARHREIRLDSHRSYILVYGWIRGRSAVEVAESVSSPSEWVDTFLRGVTLRAIEELAERGFRMLDIKPDHIVLRVHPDGSLSRRRTGELAYALVDYELLERIAPHG